MRITYDAEAHAVYIYIKEGLRHLRTLEADRANGNVNIDYSIGGEVTGIEVLHVDSLPEIEKIG